MYIHVLGFTGGITRDVGQLKYWIQIGLLVGAVGDRDDEYQLSATIIETVACVTSLPLIKIFFILFFVVQV